MVARLKDVAARAGVSVRTVSNVVNDYPHVKPEVRARVQAAVRELGYQPNMAARQLRRGRTGMIALAVPDLRSPYFAELAGEVLRAAARRDLTLLIEQTGGDARRETELARGPRSQVVDGLLLSALSAEPDDLPPRSDAPALVLLGERVVDPRYDHVAIDNVAAARQATRHLLDGGRRRVAAVGVRRTGEAAMADLRLQGFLQAHDDVGVEVDPGLVVETPWFNRADGHEAVRALASAGARPDGLFCFTDLLAIGAMHGLRELGLRVPADVAVVGFDDTEEGRFAAPALTSIAPDKSAIAEHAVDLLVRRIEGREPARAVEDVPGFTLEVRASAP